MVASQAVENIYGPGGLWGFLQMPFGDYGPQDVPWPNIPIQISKQYYAMMQACIRAFKTKTGCSDCSSYLALCLSLVLMALVVVALAQVQATAFSHVCHTFALSLGLCLPCMLQSCHSLTPCLSTFV